jgi:hypothetical protein
MSDEREQKEQDTFGLHRQRMEALGVLAEE